MASPILDEDVIMSILSTPVMHSSLNDMQNAALMAIVDAHDRKLTREEMIGVVGCAVQLHSMASKYRMMASISDMFDGGLLDANAIATAINRLHAVVGDNVKQLAPMMERIRQCPLDTDKVH